MHWSWSAPYETSVPRICARDGIAPEMARRRLDAQTPLETLRAAATAELVTTARLMPCAKSCDPF